MEPGWWFEGSKEILSMQKLWSETMPKSESSYHEFCYVPPFQFKRKEFPIAMMINKAHG
jgi:hypothetical protein